MRSEKRAEKVQNQQFNLIKKGFESIYEAMIHLINAKKEKRNYETTITNSVKALELKALSFKIEEQKSLIEIMTNKINIQDERIADIEYTVKNIPEKTVAKELFPPLPQVKPKNSHQKPAKTPKNLPTPQVGNNDLINETLIKAKVITKKTGGYNITEKQSKIINDNINEKIEAKVIGDKITTINLEEKNKRVQKHLDHMSQTIGIRLEMTKLLT